MPVAHSAQHRFVRLVALIVGLAAAATAQAQTFRVSVASDGTQGNDFSIDPAISSGGRFVAFASRATNLVPGDRNANPDIFVHDRDTGQTSLITVGHDGTPANGGSYSPAISADGRFVAFQSYASNLVRNDRSNGMDVFLHDRFRGETTRVSVARDGSDANFESSEAALSDDGRFVAFSSSATNLVAVDTNGRRDVFVYDTANQVTTRVSVATDGTQGNGISSRPALSGDGRFVAFESGASNLVRNDGNGVNDVFVHDRSTGSTRRVSTANDGTEGNGGSFSAYLSADGGAVSFASSSTNLVAADTNRDYDLFVRDAPTQTTRVSVDSNGTQMGLSHSSRRGLSSDGNFVAFVFGDVFLHNRQTRQTTRVSVGVGGAQTNGVNSQPAVSTGGGVVAFESEASNLVPGDTNNTRDIFVRVLDPSGCDGCGSVPGAPSHLTATEIRGSTVRLDWFPPSTSAPIDTYVFRVGLTPAATDIEFATGSPVGFYEVTNVPLGTYYVRVHARNSFGMGPPSNEIVLSLGCAEAPGAPTALNAVVRDGVVRLTWAASSGCPATSYILEAGSAPGASNLFAGNVGNATSVAASAGGGIYYVRVRGRNGFGISGASAEVVVLVP